MARKTAESSSVESQGDADVHEPTSQQTPAPAAPIGATHGIPDGPDLSVNWFEVFPMEDSSAGLELPDDSAHSTQIGGAQDADSRIATAASSFYVSSSTTASRTGGDRLPRSLIVPTLFVDTRKPGATLMPPASTDTPVAPRRRPLSRQFMKWLDAKELRWGTWLETTARRSATGLMTTTRRVAVRTHDTRNWLTARGGVVVGSLVCLVLILPSVPYRSSSTVDTSAVRDVDVAPATPAAPVLSPLLPPLPSPTSESPQPAASRSSATVKPTAQLLPAPRVDVIVGKLVVSSDPVGASVFLNQRFVGKTPLETSVKAGSYAVVIEHEGARWADVVLVRGDRVTRVERQLQTSRR